MEIYNRMISNLLKRDCSKMKQSVTQTSTRRNT
jgi:hypothetical protein